MLEAATAGAVRRVEAGGQPPTAQVEAGREEQSGESAKTKEEEAGGGATLGKGADSDLGVAEEEETTTGGGRRRQHAAHGGRDRAQLELIDVSSRAPPA